MTRATWLDRPEQWARLADALVKKGEAGIDSETYGQPNRTSPQWRTRIHCWSIAVLGDVWSPRGYRHAHGVALPREAMENAELRAAIAGIKLWAHNAPHDRHSFANEGLELEIADTLQWARVAAPGHRDYGLKTKGVKVGMETWALGKKGRDGFTDLVKYSVEEVHSKVQRSRVCVCGARPCRSRQTSDWWDSELGWFRKHERIEVVTEVPVTKVVEKRYEVPDFVPGHPRWEPWLDYVVVDAVSGIELVDWLRNLKTGSRPYPWRTK